MSPPFTGIYLSRAGGLPLVRSLSYISPNTPFFTATLLVYGYTSMVPQKKPKTPNAVIARLPEITTPQFILLPIATRR